MSTSRVVITGRGRRAFDCRPVLRAALLSASVAAACGTVAGKTTTACDGLVYDQSGLTRAAYLPCATEMMTTLDELATYIENMLRGDGDARTDARAGVRELRSLLHKAGGRNLLERWDDRALTSLNVGIWNTFTHHEACMLVAGQLFGRPPLGDEKYREAARSECSAYRRAYQDAKTTYRRLL